MLDSATAACVAGSCRYFCDVQRGDCNSDLGAVGSDGCETSLSDSVASCGACGSVCGAGDVCVGGACGRTTGGRENEEFDTGTGTGVDYDETEDGLVLDASATTNDYLWLPNTDQSTLTKWDPVTNTEVGRYYVGLESGECSGLCCHSSSCNMPSRVVVDGGGDAYVANRGFGMQGTVTKVAARLEDCVDRNMNGRIDTSTDGTPMPWNADGVSSDECVLWNAPVDAPGTLLRAIAIDAGDAAHPNGYPWVGSFNGRRFYKLDPDTGAVLVGPVGVGFAPYGAVVLSDGMLYASGLGTRTLARIDTTSETPTSTTLTIPAISGVAQGHYGMTADGNGRLWFSNQHGIQGYDPSTGQATGSVNLGYGRMLLGITADGDGRIWSSVWSNPLSLVYWDADDFNPGGLIAPAEVSQIEMPAGFANGSAIGSDSSGTLWYTNYGTSGTRLFRVNPDTGDVTAHEGPGRVYSYSDFTGGVRRIAIATGSYDEVFDGICANPTWERLVFDATTPADAEVEFVVRTATTVAGLDTAEAVSIGIAPTDSSPHDIAAALTAAGVMPRRYLELTTILRGVPGSSPIVRGYDIDWSCP